MKQQQLKLRDYTHKKTNSKAEKPFSLGIQKWSLEQAMVLWRLACLYDSS